MSELTYPYNPWQTVARHFSGKPADLPHRGPVDEMTGWKVARLLDPGTGRFAGLAFGEYTMSQVARCHFDQEHLPPTVGCECGFHALRSRSHAESLMYGRRSGLVLLRVELYGTIVVHRDGVRAEEQDVVEMLLPARCARLGCTRPTIGVRPRGGRWPSVCAEHAGAGTVGIAAMHAALGVDVNVIPTDQDRRNI